MKTPNHNAQNKPKNKAGLFSRKVAHQALINVLDKNKPLATALSETSGYQNLEPNDKALAKQLVMTTLRRYNQLDKIINSMLDRPLGNKGLPTTLWMMLGAAQILFMKVENHAAVNTTVEMVGRDRNSSIRTKKNLVNAILRNITREIETLKLQTSEHPEEAIVPWLRERWKIQFGDETLKAIATQILQEPKLDLSFQSQKAMEDFAIKLDGTILKPSTLRVSPKGPIEKLAGFRAGLWWVQDISATIPANLLGNINGKKVLDLCAAPGGKTLQLLTKGAEVTALDKSETRVTRLHENLKRFGKKTEVIVKDALKYKPDEKFDAILLDAPCSATGTLKKHPDLMLLKNEESITPLYQIQKDILNHAFKLLKPGGIMVYCVCSLEPEEGIEQISSFLQTTPNANRENIQQSELGDLSEALTPEGDAFILPTHLKDKGGADGFFISRLVKAAE